MWNEIKTDQDIHDFLEKFYYFHDDCIKEIRYISGAYNDRGMYVVNDRREVEILLQGYTGVILKFVGVEKMHLAPVSPDYTCEILEATIFRKNGKMYWANDRPDPDSIEHYTDTWICAQQLFWCEIDASLGKEPYYRAPEEES